MSIISEIITPNPVLQHENFSLTLITTPGLLVIGTQYNYDDSFGNSASTIVVVSNSITFNVINNSNNNGLCSYSVKDINGGGLYFSGFNVEAVCFGENTQIKCLVNKKEKFVNIKNIYVGDLVKTYKGDYKKVKYIGIGKIYNSPEKTKNKMYKMDKSKNSKLIDDLYITGGHSILKHKLNKKQEEQMNSSGVKKNYLTVFDRKKQLAFYSDKFEPISDGSTVNLYGLVLENDDIHSCHGIYANGLLVESTSEHGFLNVGKLQQINLSKNI
jgi:hypothetical protein